MQINRLWATPVPDIRRDEQVLFAQVAEQALCLTFASGALCCCLPAGWQGLLAVRGEFEMTGGAGAQILPMPEASLVKLQVFIDLGGALIGQGPRPTSWAALAVSYETLDSDKKRERWYIEQAMRGGVSYRAFANVLRHNENYWLVRFLLEQGASSEKLTWLAQRYGVSVSHFRRLCRQALGGATKPALRDWRTAQALLSMSLEDRSLTDVALAFGYASSSHFSKEIREQVGFAPSRLADITHLSGK
ncbi:transcriptional regulator [Pseudomonas sp. RIT-PI-q]|uniref:helix-turn-helix domain-containing protein n=1 Tax=Pseudomonas sp. RIT-PI-q TaxID=1690247 RepID=UPI0006CDC7B3|nr:helix-turn-helix domain-containing protein [Pseudomonas sp. RIT-PI-q]KPG98651.1 transcriptional regulator [Pseudomonas sp. RIT-PI-q]